ncbi:hypothetical protein [Enterococcus sp. AZ196]|uniref:hypothetical protein n=1 Tax=Enterococcus sp. AZ196 TaxID=2774659 RepID=UPI003D2E23EA
MKNKHLFGLLQGLFTIGTGILSVGFVAVSGFGVGMNLLNLEKIAAQSTIDVQGAGNLEALKAASSPLMILSVLLILAILIGISRLSSLIFKKLKQNEIFVVENVEKMKCIALLAGSLSILSSLPTFLMNHSGIGSGYMFDLGYLIVALLLLSFAKVWDRANELV